MSALHLEKREPITSSGDTSALSLLSTIQVAERLRQETARFTRGLPFDDRPGLELFRRAIARRDEDAWALLYQQYEPLMLTWINQHPGAPAILEGEGGAAPLINAGFTRFFCAMTAGKMGNFTSLSALLMYLKMCVRSAVSDEARALRSRWKHEQSWEQGVAFAGPDDGTAQELACSPEDVVVEREQVWAWRETILERAPLSERERAILSLKLEGARSQEIARQLGIPVKTVYWHMRSARERIRRRPSPLSGTRHDGPGRTQQREVVS